MAEKKRNSTRSKSSGKAASSKRTSQAAKNKNQPKPIRREVGAFVCLFLAVIVVLGLFRVDAVFISLVIDLIRGLMGAGVYVMPFVLLLDFVILLFHDGRPVRLRVTCTVLAALSVGILAHLLSRNTVEIPWEFAMVGELWRTGIGRMSGGLLAGFLAVFLELIISKIGAVLLSVVLLILCTLTGFNMTVMSLYRAIQSRPRPEYEPMASSLIL